MEQAAPAGPVSTSAPPADDDDDDELQYQGHTGAIALADFPHARENCVTKPFRFGAEQQHCANCYCYVCDDLASKCPQWDSHCAATHTKQVWQQARQAWKTKDAPAAPAAAAAAPAAAARNPTSRSRRAQACTTGARACTQVYPVGCGAGGLLPSVQLRPYQKQSLAFMLDIEKSTDPGLLGRRDELGYRFGVRGGILADEMGMGKTMVCISLVLANPPKPGVSKTTMCIVNNSLVQQWYDEFKRYAPKLNVKKHYASSKVKSDDMLGIRHHHLDAAHEAAGGTAGTSTASSSTKSTSSTAGSTGSSWLERHSIRWMIRRRCWLVTGTPIQSGMVPAAAPRPYTRSSLGRDVEVRAPTRG